MNRLSRANASRYALYSVGSLGLFADFRSEGRSSLRRGLGWSEGGKLQASFKDTHQATERPDRSRRGILGEPGVSRRSCIPTNTKDHER
jgi:hypothetical protein